MRSRIPGTVFAAAFGELCARLWIELEFLAQACGQIGPSEGIRDLILGAEILRLELLVLIDHSRSPRWRQMLSEEQCAGLCSTLTDVLAALQVEPTELEHGINEAQGRVLDELLIGGPQIRQGDGAFVRSGRSASEAAVDELLGLIHERAAAGARACRAATRMRQAPLAALR